MEKRDFSKIEDQEKFKELTKQEQEKIVGAAQEEADKNAKEKPKIKEIALSHEQRIGKEIIVKRLLQGFVHDFTEIKQDFNLPEEIFNSPEVQEAAKQGIVRNLMSETSKFDAIEIKNKLNLPEEIINSSEVQEAAKQVIIDSLSHGYIDSTSKIKDGFNIPDHIIQSSEVQEAAKDYMKKVIRYSGIKEAIKRKSFFLSDSSFWEVAKEEIIKKLFGIEERSEVNLNYAIEIKKLCGVPNDIILSTEVQKIAKDQIIRFLSRYSFSSGDGVFIDKAIKIKNEFDVSGDLGQSSEVQGIIKELIIKFLKSSDYSENLIKLLNAFKLSDIILNLLEVQQVAKKGFINSLSNGDIDLAIKIKDKFNLPEEIVQEQEAAKQGMIKLLSMGHIDDVIRIKDQFKLPEEIVQEVAKQEIIKCLSNSNGDVAVQIKEKFKISKEFIFSSEIEQIIKEKIILGFSGNDGFHIDVARKILPEKSVSALILSPEVLQAAKKGIFDSISRDDIEGALNIKNEFSTVLSSEESIQAINLCINNNSMEAAMIFNNPVVDAHLEKLSKIFTNGFSAEIYSISKEISNGQITEELRDIGITETGDKGIRQLAELSRKYTNEMVFVKENNTEKFANSPILRELFASYIRFNSSQWGNHNDDELISTLETYENVKGEIEPLPEYMKPCGVIRIDTINKEDRVIWSEQFLSRYNTLINSIKEAKDMVSLPEKGEIKKPFSTIAKEMQNEINILKNSLEEKLGKVPNEKAKIGLENRIKSLAEINPRSLEKFQQNISEMYKFKELHPLIRKAVFAWSLAKNKDQAERMEKIAQKKPDIDTTSTLLDFIDHITNQETFEKYFTDKKSADAFNEIINTRAIQQDFAKAQNRSVAGTVAVEFIPQRNVMTEFSGQIGDACWASKYDSILESFPNFSSVIMMQDPGGKNERLVGSCFLIETESRDGKPLLVIRGLNPLENFINRLSIKDFYDKFMLYVKEIAAKDNRRVAIAVGDHSGGSGTNRPALYEHMASLWNDAEDAPLLDKDTNFNGYDISDSCMMVE